MVAPTTPPLRATPPQAGGGFDPHHELPPGHELLDLPSPHHGAGWGWLFALVVGTVVTFIVTIVLLATTANPVLIIAVAIITFIFVTLLTRGVADQAL